ncbi:MAG: Dam family site-specific DNA-(adenine-N6)-methyltransferase [Anaerolineae bacterium]
MLFEFAPSEIQLQPPLKWAGGKRWLVPHLHPIWAKHRGRRFVEPFCGGLAVALGLNPRRAVLNDINVHVVNFYRWLQRGLTIEIPMKNEAQVYYAHRDAFNNLITHGQEQTRRAAELFYYLNRTGYNGLCRVNRRGEYNVPFGRHKSLRYNHDLVQYQPVLNQWDFSYADFAQLQLEPGDFVYADPPYDVEFVNYSKGGFHWDDQVRLAQWLAQHPGPVLISNQATERIVTLYRSLNFDLRYFEAPRRISSDGNRKPAREVLATRNL